jgi:hypothetical protein
MSWFKRLSYVCSGALALCLLVLEADTSHTTACQVQLQTTGHSTSCLLYSTTMFWGSYHIQKQLQCLCS